MYMVLRLIAIVWVICIGLFSTPAATTVGAETYPQRGRVKIVDNVVVADNGSLLRGASGNSFEVQRYSRFSWWTNLRDNYKLNTVRMFMYCCKPVDTIVNPVNMVDLNRLATKMDLALKLQNKQECTSFYTYTTRPVTTRLSQSRYGKSSRHGTKTRRTSYTRLSMSQCTGNLRQLMQPTSLIRKKYSDTFALRTKNTHHHVEPRAHQRPSHCQSKSGYGN